MGRGFCYDSSIFTTEARKVPYYAAPACTDI